MAKWALIEKRLLTLTLTLTPNLTNLYKKRGACSYPHLKSKVQGKNFNLPHIVPWDCQWGQKSSIPHQNRAWDRACLVLSFLLAPMRSCLCLFRHRLLRSGWGWTSPNDLVWQFESDSIFYLWCPIGQNLRKWFRFHHMIILLLMFLLQLHQ